MKILAITQARIGSTRLPNKVLKKIGEKTLLQMHLERVQRSKLINQLIVATTDEIGVEGIVEVANLVGIKTFKGNLNDVLDRFYSAYKIFGADAIVRVTSDCPLIDPSLIDSVIKLFCDSGHDYVSNTLNPTFPDGVDVEVFKATALEQAWHEATLKSDREHVSAYIWKNSTFLGKDKFKSSCFENNPNYSQYRLTVDTPDDFVRIEKLVEMIGDDGPWLDYVSCIQEHEDIFDKIKAEERNLGYKKSLERDK
ncbi:MAG: hypothetical protein A2X86_12340 [Bdellovibrionales bacterium GWA2_49_15]|nr:MAG: hypothetical protein A2X86_12340 [Bdellovibrionales bacterium GWA2_49_15]